MTQQTEHYKTIATKISPEAYRQLEQLARKHGIKLYELLQMCADILIRYMSDAHNLTPEIERAMAIFEHMTGWAGSMNFAEPTGEKRISEAIYFLTSPKKKGCRAVLITLPFFDKMNQTENVQIIVERTIELVCPELYRRLRLLAAEHNIQSILDMIYRLIDYHSTDSDTEEIRKTFEDALRAENNKPVAYGERTKRKKHYTPDTMPTFHFSKEDVSDLPELKEHFDIDQDAIGI
jgi:hypothetical protein